MAVLDNVKELISKQLNKPVEEITEDKEIVKDLDKIYNGKLYLEKTNPNLKLDLDKPCCLFGCEEHKNSWN